MTAAPAAVLPAGTALGAVVLRVADLAGTAAYYAEALGLVPVGRHGADALVVLGSGGQALVVLSEAPKAAPRAAGEVGLAHTALLVDGPVELARVAERARQHPCGRFVGGADHLVSQSFYLTDPEGNGVELYADRPPEQWRWEDGRAVMGNEPLDLDDFLAEHSDSAAGARLRLGHVHLEVGDVAMAVAFYGTALGLVVTAELPGAAFLSWGGYHHRVAVNSWSTQGAGRRGAALGLERLSLVLPGRGDLADLADRLECAGVPVRVLGTLLEVEDPWGTTVEVAEASGR